MTGEEFSAEHSDVELLYGVDFERELLASPFENAGLLYELYTERIRRIIDHATEHPDLFKIEDFFEQCNRQKTVSKLLPPEDSRSYDFFSRSLKTSQQG